MGGGGYCCPRSLTLLRQSCYPVCALGDSLLFGLLSGWLVVFWKVPIVANCTALYLLKKKKGGKVAKKSTAVL